MSVFQKLLTRLSFFTNRELSHLATSQSIQLLLMRDYRQRAAGGQDLPRIADCTLHCLSSLAGHYLFVLSVIGMKTRITVELCAGDGIHCSSGNLVLNHEYGGLLVDGGPKVLRANDFYRRMGRSMHLPTLKSVWLTRDNVNDVIGSSSASATFDRRLEGEIDVLTLDVDGMEYWLWQAIEVIRPRLVVCEYQTCWGPERSVTVPYGDRFVGTYHKGVTAYAGASLAALTKLATRKEYRLVGCDHRCYNAFFLRNDVGTEHFPEISPRECFFGVHADFAQQEILPKVQSLEWEEV